MQTNNFSSIAMIIPTIGARCQTYTLLLGWQIIVTTLHNSIVRLTPPFMTYRTILPTLATLFLALILLSSCKQTAETKVSSEELKGAMQAESDSVNYLLKTAESYFIQLDYSNAKEFFLKVKQKSQTPTMQQYATERMAECDEKMNALPKIEPEPKPEPPTVDWWNSLDKEWQEILRVDYFEGSNVGEKEVKTIFDNLLILNFAGKPVNTLEPIRPLVKSRIVVFNNTQVASLEPIAEHKNMLSIRASNTPLTSLEPLQNLKKLQELQVAYTKVSSLDPLKDLIDLLYVDFEGTPITNLDALNGAHRLKHLDISYTRVSSLEPIKNIGAMEELYLINTSVTDLTPVARLGLLRKLNISGTKVSSLAPLNNLKNLENLYCKATNISSDEIYNFKLKHPTCEVVHD